MSAMALFKDVNDANFRLAGTHIVVGKMIFKIHEVYPDYDSKPLAKASWLNSPDVRRRPSVFCLRLDHLPMRVMYDCPYGYLGDFWYSRGPSRDRYQGLNQESLWGIRADGDIIPFCPHTIVIGNALGVLINQPRKVDKGKRISKGAPLTNLVMVSKDDYVIYKGNYIGDYQGKRQVRLASTELPSAVESALSNARLTICN